MIGLDPRIQYFFVIPDSIRDLCLLYISLYFCCACVVSIFFFYEMPINEGQRCLLESEFGFSYSYRGGSFPNLKDKVRICRLCIISKMLAVVAFGSVCGGVLFDLWL